MILVFILYILNFVISLVVFFCFVFYFFFFFVYLCFLFFFFFFSSRRRHTRWNCDWSSDVCSSDLEPRRRRTAGGEARRPGDLQRPRRRRRRRDHRGELDLRGQPDGQHPVRGRQIGRASCRERV